MVATIFYTSPDGLKYWYCIEHYDGMAETYVEMAEEGQEWCITMVKHNGW